MIACKMRNPEIFTISFNQRHLHQTFSLDIRPLDNSYLLTIDRESLNCSYVPNKHPRLYRTFPASTQTDVKPCRPNNVNPHEDNAYHTQAGEKNMDSEIELYHSAEMPIFKWREQGGDENMNFDFGIQFWAWFLVMTMFMQWIQKYMKIRWYCGWELNFVQK